MYHMDRVVTPKAIRDYARKWPTAQPSLEHWLKTVKAANWRNPADVKASFNDVDPVTVGSGRTVYAFNIERNRHRLIAAIHFNTSKVYVLLLMTHKEYDKNRWKDEL